MITLLIEKDSATKIPCSVADLATARSEAARMVAAGFKVTATDREGAAVELFEPADVVEPAVQAAQEPVVETAKPQAKKPKR